MTKKSKIFLGAALLWGLFIFLNSMLPGDTSTKMSDAVVYRLPGWLSFLDVHTLTVFVRKSAHFCEYALLGSLWALTFHFSGGFRPRNLGNVLFPCLFWAVADEFLQTFIEDRTGLVQDVVIDLGGILTGVLLTALVIWITQRHKGHKEDLCSGS